MGTNDILQQENLAKESMAERAEAQGLIHKFMENPESLGFSLDSNDPDQAMAILAFLNAVSDTPYGYEPDSEE